jgi:hypothetical protein
LKENFGAEEIRLLILIETKEIYYCEFLINGYTVKCLLLDKNFEEISLDVVEFDF